MSTLPFPLTWILLLPLLLLMAWRAFRSGTAADRILGIFLAASVLLCLLAPPVASICAVLLVSAWYLASQIVTGARPLSRVLPLLAAGLAVVGFFMN